MRGASWRDGHDRRCKAYNRAVYVIGLTGAIAVGKSTVARMLAAKGAAVIDGDQVVHTLYAHNRALVARIAARFGPAVLAPDGSLDRAALGRTVFPDPAALADLETLVFPEVLAEQEQLLVQAQRERRAVVVLDAVKLVESGAGRLVDELWIVTAPPAAQRQPATGPRPRCRRHRRPPGRPAALGGQGTPVPPGAATAPGGPPGQWQHTGRAGGTSGAPVARSVVSRQWLVVSGPATVGEEARRTSLPWRERAGRLGPTDVRRRAAAPAPPAVSPRPRRGCWFRPGRIAARPPCRGSRSRRWR